MPPMNANLIATKRYAVLLDQPCLDAVRAYDLLDLERDRGRRAGQQRRKLNTSARSTAH